MALSKVDGTVASRRVDLVFAMDCTSSMGRYIEHAQKNITKIANGIHEQETVDLRFALVEYRDHEQPDHKAGNSGFVTRVLDYTEHLREIQKRLDQCTAKGGAAVEILLKSCLETETSVIEVYWTASWIMPFPDFPHNIPISLNVMLNPTHRGDPPEAIADALQAILELSWRKVAVKICVLIADAPPHGLGCSGDAFETGCPLKLDPMEIANKLAENAIMVYTVGCEPSITPYKDWFVAISHITSGQYLPLASPDPLFRAIIGAAYEGLSMSEIAVHVGAIMMTSNRKMTEEALTESVMEQMKGSKTKLLQSEKGALEKPTKQAVEIAKLKSMTDVRRIFKPSYGADSVKSSAPDDYVVVDSDLTREHVSRVVKQVFASSSGKTDLLMTSKTAVFKKM